MVCNCNQFIIFDLESLFGLGLLKKNENLQFNSNKNAGFFSKQTIYKLGCRKHLSVTHQAYSIINITSGKKEKKHTAVAFLDIEKEYDKV